MKIYGYGGGLGKGKYLDFAAGSDSAAADSSVIKPGQENNDGRGKKGNSRGKRK